MRSNGGAWLLTFKRTHVKSSHLTAVVAVILALGVAISIVILSVSELSHANDGHISTEEATLLATVLGAGIGAIATYLGQREGRDNGPQPTAAPPVLVTRYPPEPPYDQDPPTIETPVPGNDHTTYRESDPSA